MLKRFVFPAVIAMFALVACTKEFENPVFEREVSTEVHSLSVGIEAGSYLPADETKATMEAIVRVKWQEGDQVSVVNATKGTLLGGYLRATEAGATVIFEGDVTGTIDPGDDIYYIYPRIALNDEPEDFAGYEISLKEQQYDAEASGEVCFHGYAEDTAASGTISKRIKFNLVTAYVHLNMSNIPAKGEALTSVDLSNVNGGFKWVLNSGAVSADPCFVNQGISVTCYNTEVSQKGNAVVRFAVPASPETTVDRVLTVNGTYFNSNYSKLERKSAVYYNQLYSTWKKFVEAGTVAAANEAFANGETMVKITSVGDVKTLYLPQTTEGVTIEFENPDETVTVKYGPAPDAEPATKAAITGKPATVNIATNDITKFTVTGIDNIVWLAGNQAALANALNNAKSTQTVALSNDIQMSGEWMPVTTNGYTVDGRNYVISNMTITDCGLDYAGLIRFMSGGIVKNLTVKDANIVYNSGKSARGGAIVGISYGGTIENCHAENVSIKGYQKMGGIVGYLAQSGNGFVVRNCSAKNISFTNNTTDLTYQAGGIVGYTLNYNGDILVEGCSVSDITINNQYDGSEGANSAYYCGTFIGSLDNQAVKEGLKIELKNNTISGTNTPQIDHMYANTYFGWANNPEATSKDKKAYLATILIDGQEWTPNYPVKIVGGKAYATLAEALAAATEGQTVQILKAGDYTVQTLSTKAAVVEATVEGVVFNRTAGGSVTSYGTTSPVTVKNITWNIGSNNYQYFNCNVENCTINGRPSIHTFASFKGCTLINTYASDYCITTYGSPCTFENCTFKSQGKFVNVYGESQSSSKEVTATNCKFVNLKSSVYKAAFNIKGNADGQIQHTHVVIENCTTEGLFPDHTTTDGNAIFFDGGLIMFDDPAWEDDVYAVVDDVTYYPYFSIDAQGNYSVNNETGLKKAIKHWNTLKVSGEKTITLADGTYNVSDMAIFQNYAGKSLLIKAENQKQAVITPNAGSKQLIFVVAGQGKKYSGHITIDGIKFDMSGAANKDIESDVISISDAVGTNLPADEKALYSGDHHYGHDITIKNCEIIGLGTDNEHSSVVRADGSNGNAYNVKVQDCEIDKVGYVLTSKITTLAEVSGCTITDSKCVINNTADQTEYKVINNTISTYHDYCIRVNFGPLTVSGNTFNCTYSGAAADAGVVVLRGSTGNEAIITGNTITKASGTMYDVYCVTSWNVNGETVPAGSGKNL